MQPAIRNCPTAAEEIRLQELSGLRILDTPSEERFDRYTRLVADVFNVAIAAISLTDRDRQWFKSVVGLDCSEIPREGAFCSYALDVDFLEVPDALEDPRFRDYSLVLGSPFVRFYAGAVLYGPTGQALGTLCLIDTEPRRLTPAERERLISFARLVEDEINVERRDVVTGLLDGVSVAEWLGNDIADAARHRRDMTVIDLQVVNAEQIVTLHGQSTSYELMRVIARRLQNAVRHSDTIGRSGRHGFLIALPGLSDQAQEAQRIRTLLGQLSGAASVDALELRPRLAAGVSRFPSDATTLESLLDHARTALRTVVLDTCEWGFCFYSEGRHAYLRRGVEQAHRLAKAVEQNALQQVYQPVIDLNNGCISGFESLARWHDAVYGDVSPAVFIPLADADPAVRHALTLWSIDAACRQMADLNRQRSNHLLVSVNIPAAELLHADFADTLRAAASRHGVRGDQVVLELIEQSFITNVDAAIKVMNTLRADGFQFSVDDFGTGYSSLGYLQKLPLDIVKIDRCFIQNVADSPVAEELVRGIINISRALGLRIVAEGIETDAQLEALRVLSCDRGQGFLLGRPAPAEQLLEQLRLRNGWE
jgi:diguanylate cyclase (GGDEF)-like protein